MCASCFNHLLADSKLKDEQTTWYVEQLIQAYLMIENNLLVQIVVAKFLNPIVQEI